MSQESQIGSLYPPPVIRAQPLPFDALQYQSTITHIGQISTILSKHGLEISPDLPVQVSRPEERSCHASQGFDKLLYTASSQEHLKTVALLPLRSYFRNHLNHVKITPFHFQTNAYRILSALKSLYHWQSLGEPSPEEIFYLLSLKKKPQEPIGVKASITRHHGPKRRDCFKMCPTSPQA